MACVVSTDAETGLLLSVLQGGTDAFERVVPRPAGRAMTIRER